VIKSGGVLVYPTDTLYALGVDPRNEAAVRRLFAIKGRPVDQPILLLIPDARSVARWAAGVNAAAERLMARFWPGPLTLLFPARSDVMPELTAGSGRIGLRVPGSPLTRDLLAAVGTELTGTSANRSGGDAPRTADTVLRTIGGQVDLILDGGPAAIDRPSTVIDVSREEPAIVRQGAIDAARLL
jgi:L-threonylcarbamoyladenylate synthase